MILEILRKAVVTSFGWVSVSNQVQALLSSSWRCFSEG
jgi:hypothetical protein